MTDTDRDPLSSTGALTRAERASLQPADWDALLARLETLLGRDDDTVTAVRKGAHMWLSKRYREAADYTEQQAAWQVRHGADRNDMTPDQRQRLRLHNSVVDRGLDAGRVAFAYWLVETGRVSDE